MNTEVRVATQQDVEACSSLVRLSFGELCSHAWSAEATQKLYEEVSATTLATKVAEAACALVAHEAESIVGFLLLPRPSYLSLLFVHPGALRRGIGKALWEFARSKVELEHQATKTVELNATSNARSFYESLGFVCISSEFEVEGRKATRMACWLPARALGAGLASNPSIERTSQRPLRALCAAAHVKR